MNAEEQEEHILRLRTLSGGRTGLRKWKVNASFTGHAGLCMRAHRGRFLWTTRCRRGGHGGVESFQVAASGFGPSMLLSTHEAPAGIYRSTKERGKKKYPCGLSGPCFLSGCIVKEAGKREQHHGGGGGGGWK